MNLSVVEDNSTAFTNAECCLQRASNLKSLGSRKVLELCVGPSLATLESAYHQFGISVTGNDIDKRWKTFYEEGNWIIGDALSISYSGFDTIVFAPPLSKGCTGKREDSLQIEQVTPSYYEFLKRMQTENEDLLGVLVLPGRSISTYFDRVQFFKLMSKMYSLKLNFKHERLTDGKITKYYDVYFSRGDFNG